MQDWLGRRLDFSIITPGNVLRTFLAVWILVAAIAAAWQFDLIPGKIGATRTETARDGTPLHVREVWAGRGRILEVMSPDGQWHTCRIDCETAYRTATR